MAVETQNLISSLNSELCPTCGGRKKSKRSVCFTCWRSLTTAQQDALYNRIGCGYEEAMEAARVQLDCQELHLKSPKPSGKQP